MADRSSAFKTFQSSNDVPLSKRCEKPNYRLSQVTNFAKAVLIARVARKSSLKTVLDLGCGRGSDASKFGRVGATYYCGVDFAPSRIVQAQDRKAKDHRSASIVCDFHANSMETFMSSYFSTRKFSVASSFNAIHHAMWDSGTAQAMFHSLNAALVATGFFIGIIPDAEAIRQHMALCKGSTQMTTWKFECDCVDSASSCTCRSYRFTLPGSFEAVNEPFVEWTVLQSMLLAAGFAVGPRAKLSAFATKTHLSSDDRRIWHSMKMDSTEVVSDNENKIFDMYTCFIARKVTDSDDFEKLSSQLQLTTLVS